VLGKILKYLNELRFLQVARQRVGKRLLSELFDGGHKNGKRVAAPIRHQVTFQSVHKLPLLLELAIQPVLSEQEVRIREGCGGQLALQRIGTL